MPCLGGPSYDESDAIAGRAACDLLEVIRKHHPKAWGEMQNHLKKTTLVWVEEHDKEDRERKEAEREERNRRALASKAKSKLTAKEREALGIS